MKEYVPAMDGTGDFCARSSRCIVSEIGNRDAEANFEAELLAALLLTDKVGAAE
jgi:hypothetical protein